MEWASGHVPAPADVNECLTLGLCEDSECVNTRGSYLCTCRPGLLLDPSRSRCVCECSEGPGGGAGGEMGPLGSTGQAESRNAPRPQAATPPRTGRQQTPCASSCWDGDSHCFSFGFRRFFEGFAVWDFLPPLFLSNHCCPICCLICFEGMCVAVMSH